MRLHPLDGTNARPTRRGPLPVIATLVGTTALFACQDDGTGPPAPDPAFTEVSAALTDELASILDLTNVALGAEGAAFRAATAEFITGGGANEAGSIVIAKDVGNKRLDEDFVPFDPRRAWSGPAGGTHDDITYAIDRTLDAVPLSGGVSGAQTTAAIQRAMATWDAAQCSDLPVVENPDFGLDIGIVAFLSGLGGSPFVLADVQHAGFRDINFAPGIIGVTFTFVFVDANGPTDIDNNGKFDVAFREIYYDPSFFWAIDAGPPFVDVESIALHEAGHGLSQAHFGTIFIKNNGSIKAAPKAVMNALYFEVTQSLLGTDTGGHCSNWASWPNQ